MNTECGDFVGKPLEVGIAGMLPEGERKALEALFFQKGNPFDGIRVTVDQHAQRYHDCASRIR